MRQSKKIRRNVTIDWTVKESVRARLRVLLKKILKKHDYPPDKQAQAAEMVLKQAGLLCADRAAVQKTAPTGNVRLVRMTTGVLPASLA